MSDTHANESEADAKAGELSALFGSLILQQANMATLLLGKAPHPQGGESMRDLEAAKLFIDHLDMLEAKTKGNLSKEESTLLKQTLMGLRLAFVEAVENPEPGTRTPAADSPAPETQPSSGTAAPPPAADEDHRKKFTKKY